MNKMTMRTGIFNDTLLEDAIQSVTIMNALGLNVLYISFFFCSDLSICAQMCQFDYSIYV